jgi:hypothetical protein
MFPEDESEGDGRLLDQRISLPQCQVEFVGVDEEDGLGVSGGSDDVMAVDEEGPAEEAFVLSFHERVRGVLVSEGLVWVCVCVCVCMCVRACVCVSLSVCELYKSG